MTNLTDELNVRPRQRVTIPEGHIALVIPQALAGELRSTCLILRKDKRIPPADRAGIRSIAGDLLLAIVEAEA